MNQGLLFIITSILGKGILMFGQLKQLIPWNHMKQGHELTSL